MYVFIGDKADAEQRFWRGDYAVPAFNIHNLWETILGNDIGGNRCHPTCMRAKVIIARLLTVALLVHRKSVGLGQRTMASSALFTIHFQQFISTITKTRDDDIASRKRFVLACARWRVAQWCATPRVAFCKIFRRSKGWWILPSLMSAIEAELGNNLAAREDDPSPERINEGEADVFCSNPRSARARGAEQPGVIPGGRHIGTFAAFRGSIVISRHLFLQPAKLEIYHVI